MANPTDKQLKAFQRFGLNCPGTKAAATATLTFIFQGLEKTAQTVEDRVALTKAYEKKWLGKPIKIIDPQHESFECTGEVAYILAITKEQYSVLQGMADVGQRAHHKLHLFKARIRLADGQLVKFPMHLSKLELV